MSFVILVAPESFDKEYGLDGGVNTVTICL